MRLADRAVVLTALGGRASDRPVGRRLHDERTAGARMRAILSGRACRLRGVIIFALCTALILLTPLTYLEPFDPLWIGGVWDDDDSDAVIVLVKSTEIPCEPMHTAFVPFDHRLFAPLILAVWRPFDLPLRWPENRAPPDA